MSNWWDPLTGWIYGAGQQITEPIVTPIVRTLQSNPNTQTARPIQVIQQPTQTQSIQQSPEPISQPAQQQNRIPLNPISAALDPYLDVAFGVLVSGDVLSGGKLKEAFPKEVSAYQKAKEPLQSAFRQSMPLNQEQYSAYKENMLAQQKTRTDPGYIASLTAFKIGDILYENIGAPLELGVGGIEIWATWELGAATLSRYGSTGLVGSNLATKGAYLMENPLVQKGLVTAAYGVGTYIETEGFSQGIAGNISGGGKVMAEFAMASAPLAFASLGAPYAMEAGGRIRSFGQRQVETYKWNSAVKSLKYSYEGRIKSTLNEPSPLGPNELEIHSGPGGQQILLQKPTGPKWGDTKYDYVKKMRLRWNGLKWVEFTPMSQETILIQKVKPKFESSSKLKIPETMITTGSKTNSLNRLLIATPQITTAKLKQPSVTITPLTTTTKLITATPPPIAGGGGSSPYIPNKWVPNMIIPGGGGGKTPRTPPPDIPWNPTLAKGSGFIMPFLPFGGGSSGSYPGSNRRYVKWKSRNLVAAAVPGRIFRQKRPGFKLGGFPV